MLHSHCFQTKQCREAAAEAHRRPGPNYWTALLYVVWPGWFFSACKELCGLKFFSWMQSLLLVSYIPWKGTLPLSCFLANYQLLASVCGHPHPQGWLAKCVLEHTRGPSTSKGLFLWPRIKRPSSHTGT